MICKACGEDLKHKAHGLCLRCYRKQYNESHRTEHNKKAKIYREKNKADINIRYKIHYATHRDELSTKNRVYRAAHRDEINANQRRCYNENRMEINIKRAGVRSANGEMSMHENKECSLYLGVHIAERILSKVFKNVDEMPNGNIGYDFICSKRKKVDVKSSCTRLQGSDWTFSIRKNKIADMFLCIAFDNINNLKPVHLWLIPADAVNNHSNIGISESTILKWKKYELDVGRVATCCDNIKHGDKWGQPVYSKKANGEISDYYYPVNKST